MTPYGHRSSKLPAPPHVVWDDLTKPAPPGSGRPWLHLLHDEVSPRVLESERPSRVVWSSLWPSRPADEVVMELTSAGSETALSYILLGAGDLPDESRTGHIRRRVSLLLFEDLRFSYGQ